MALMARLSSRHRKIATNLVGESTGRSLGVWMNFLGRTKEEGSLSDLRCGHDYVCDFSGVTTKAN